MEQGDIVTFKDLDCYCDKSIHEIEKWHEIFKTQLEHYVKIVQSGEETDRKVYLKPTIHAQIFLL